MRHVPLPRFRGAYARLLLARAGSRNLRSMRQTVDTLSPFRHAAALGCGLLVALLAACGGGGDGTAATDPVSAAAPDAAMAEASATCGVSDFAASALARINQLRAAGASCGSRGAFAPALPLRWNRLLTRAAASHTADMAANDYFSHTSADGRSMSDRVNATGYAWSSLGENIAAGYATVDSVMDGWMLSDGHCANLMNPGFDEVGLACVAGAAGSRYGHYWTQDLARSR
jgi:uncharacterized protein YkwD